MKHTYPVRRALAAFLCAGFVSAAASVGANALEPNGNNVRFRNWVSNDPAYQFSDEYKTSVWYRNFDALTLTDNHRNNVLRVAVSQLGYHEGNSKKDFDGMNRGGSNNYIEYARLVVPNYNDNHYEWCACFVNWVLSQAHIDYAYGEISCSQWVSWLKSQHMFENSRAYHGHYTPKPADIIFFDWDENGGSADHIGYVLYVRDGTIYTIEGNSSDAVSLKSYDINARCVLGFGVPPYEEGDEPTLDWSRADGIPAGQYVVNKTGAYLYAEANTRSKKVGKTAIGHTAVLSAAASENGDFAAVTYEDMTGYMKLADLTLLTPLHTVTFLCDGETLGLEVFNPGQKSVSLPAIPAKAGYTGAWEDYSLTDTDLTLHVLWTPIRYTVTYEVDGEVLGTADYTVEHIPDLLAEAPRPERDGFSVEWTEVPVPDPAAPTDVTVRGVWRGEPNTVCPTEAPTEPAVNADTDGTRPADESVRESATDARPADAGCEGTLTAPAVLLLLSGGAWMIRRKKIER